MNTWDCHTDLRTVFFFGKTSCEVDRMVLASGPKPLENFSVRSLGMVKVTFQPGPPVKKI